MNSPSETTFGFRNLPLYHDRLVVLKSRQANLNATGSMTTTHAAERSLPLTISGRANQEHVSPTMRLIRQLEDQGQIRRIRYLGSGGVHVGGKGVIASSGMTSAALNRARMAESTGMVSYIRLRREEDADALIRESSTDQTMEYCTRVPVRYLLARGRATTAKRAGSRRASAETKDGGRASRRMGATAVPPTSPVLWNLQKIKWLTALQSDPDLAANVHVAVLDTGVDTLHPDLPGSEINYIHEYPENDVGASEKDIIGHGTHVAGTIRAIINNETGINGICRCRLSSYKIFGDKIPDEPVFDGGTPYYPYYVDPLMYHAALAACLESDVQVINLSIGGYGLPDNTEKGLFQELINKGVMVVAAMGNENTSQLSYPAAIPGVIAVGATTINDSRADFSNYGNHMSLCAPGKGIWSTLPTYAGQTGFYAAQGPNGVWQPGAPMGREANYDSWDGTSMAAPHVAAAAAMVTQKYSNLSGDERRKKLEKAVDQVPGMQSQNFSRYYGHGRLNLSKI
jgi:subtilisin family serine protease